MARSMVSGKKEYVEARRLLKALIPEKDQNLSTEIKSRIEQIKKRAYSLMESSAHQGFGPAEYQMALWLMAEKKHQEAFLYLKRADKHQERKATYLLGLCYQDGIGVKKDKTQADMYFKLSGKMKDHHHFHTHDGLPPISGEHVKVLLLGSFPGEESRTTTKKRGPQYFANESNHFYDVIFSVLFGNQAVPDDYKTKTKMIMDKGIAIYDVIDACWIIGSKDKTILGEAPAKEKITELLAMKPQVFCMGRKAERLFKTYFPGEDCHYLPQTCGLVYAKKKLAGLVQDYSVIDV